MGILLLWAGSQDARGLLVRVDTQYPIVRPTCELGSHSAAAAAVAKIRTKAVFRATGVPSLLRVHAQNGPAPLSTYRVCRGRTLRATRETLFYPWVCKVRATGVGLHLHAECFVFLVVRIFTGGIRY